jgi:hypothetical protein
MQLYDYHEIFAPGAGINMNTMERTFDSPFNVTDEVPRGNAGGTVQFRLNTSEGTTDLATGRTLDAKAEVRYLTAQGNLSTEWGQKVDQAKYDFSFSITHFIDQGQYRLADQSIGLGAARITDYNEWVNRFGTHVVVGTVRHAYLTAHFSVRRLRTDIAQQFGLSLSGSGSIGLVSASGSLDYQSLLSTIVQSEDLEVEVNTTVVNADFSEIVAKSKTNRLDKIFTSLGEMSTRLPSSIPVPVGFWLARANEIQPNLTPGPKPSGMNNPVIVQQFQDYMLCASRVARLKEIIDNSGDMYSFIGVDWLKDLTAAQDTLNQFLTDTSNQLQDWQNGKTPSHVIQMPNLAIWWPFPRLILGAAGNQGNFVDVSVDVQDADDFRLRAIKQGVAPSEKMSLEVATPQHRRHGNLEMSDPAALLGGDWRNWTIQVLSPKGPDNVLAQWPMAQPK